VIPSTVRRRVALYRRLSAAGVRRTSLLLYPLRRRLPPHHQRLDLDSGDSLLAPTVTRRMIESYLDRPRTVDAAALRRLASLTPRERETLQLLAQG